MEVLSSDPVQAPAVLGALPLKKVAPLGTQQRPGLSVATDGGNPFSTGRVWLPFAAW